MGIKMGIKNFIKSYWKDEGGQYAILFGAISAPLLVGVGMAIDISRAQAAHMHLQNAADSAVLQASVLVGSEEELEAAAREIFDANLNYTGFNTTEFDLKEDEDGNLTVTARGNIPAMFAQINGYPKLNVAIGAESEAFSDGDLEMTIAFDTTNSMGFDSTWDKALLTLNSVLDEIEDYSGTNNFFVSLVPFSDRVNVGHSRTNWLSGSTPTNWNGCVEPREETLSSSGSSNGNGNGNGNGNNNNNDDDDDDDDGVTITWALDDDKPTGSNKFEASVVGVTGGLADRGGGYPYCANVAIVPPTNDVDAITDAAANFSQSGTGRFDVGMAWAWRMMSSEWRGQWSSGGYAAANNGHARRQIAIMITDGRTEAYTWEVDKTRDWNYNEGSKAGFENMVRVCDGMKEQDMEIFMIRVDGNDHATEYMQDCASTNSHYFEVTDNATLELALKNVLKVVKANVRLSN